MKTLLEYLKISNIRKAKKTSPVANPCLIIQIAHSMDKIKSKSGLWAQWNYVTMLVLYKDKYIVIQPDGSHCWETYDDARDFLKKEGIKIPEAKDRVIDNQIRYEDNMLWNTTITSLVYLSDDEVQKLDYTGDLLTFHEEYNYSPHKPISKTILDWREKYVQ